MQYFNVQTNEMQATPAFAASAATAAVEAMNAATAASMAVGDLAMTRRALVAANAAYRAAVDKARGDARTIRLDAVLGTGAELETAMAAVASARAKAVVKTAEAAASASCWEEMDLALCRAIDELMAD